MKYLTQEILAQV
jgi:hypothetical protein